MKTHSHAFPYLIVPYIAILTLLISPFTFTNVRAIETRGGSGYALTAPPVIDIWYGTPQAFGNNGLPQRQINILGNVSDPDGIASLTYSLNGSQQKNLSLGPDTRRLLSQGDFNVELFDSELLNGANQVVINATDTMSETATSTVVVNYSRDKVWPLPYEANWDSITPINDLAQITDGKWAYDSQKGGIRPVEVGYDRMIAIGDMAWENYEAVTEITIHGVDEGGYLPPSNGPGIGLIFRWNGHTDDPVPNWQPKTGWLPLGAIGWYHWQLDHSARLEILGNDGSTAIDTSGRTLNLDTSYFFKFRVEKTGNGPLYSLKVWQVNEMEPPVWDLSFIGAAEDPQFGSLVLLTHHVDATFGKVTVTRVGSPPAPSTFQSDDFHNPDLNTSLWEFINPKSDSAYNITGSRTTDAWLNISVPAGSDHDLVLGDNRAPRVMQSVNNTDFDVEAKFESGLYFKYQMQGIIVQEDASHYLRIEFQGDGNSTRLYTADYSGNLKVTYTNTVINGRGIIPLYMRVMRNGGRFTLFYSYDGSSWTPFSTFPRSMVVNTIGVYAANAIGSTSPAFTGKIDYFFNRATPIEPEDPPEIEVNVYLPLLLNQ